MRRPQTPPGLPTELHEQLTLATQAALLELDDTRWLHWDELRRRTPPPGLTVEAWWQLLRIRRRTRSESLPILGPSKQPHTLAMPPEVFRLVRTVHEKCAGMLALPDDVLSGGARARFIASSLREEAVQSSLLEGAATTRRVAKEMLRTGRRPTSHGEQMVLANYRALERVSSWRTTPITPERILELHAIVTDGLLPAQQQGALRTDDSVVVLDNRTGETLYQPPPYQELPSRLEALCTFAEGGAEGYAEDPVIRSVLLHYWLASDHPFVDGNGRTARALFYWSMLRAGYWLTEYLPLSRVLRGRATAYARSYLHVQTDDNDTTYFVLDQLRSLTRCIDQVEEHLGRKARELRTTERALRHGQWNHRQIALLRHAVRNPDAVYTIKSHRNSHRISYSTARADLLALESVGLLQQSKLGRAFRFFPAPDLSDQLQLES